VGSVSGLARVLKSSRSPVRLSNLMEFRGTAWEAMSDYFFGVSAVDYEWSDVADENRLTKWVYTQDGVAVSDATVDPALHELDIGLTAGPDPISNQREMYTIPETATWGIAHALVEIKGEAYEAGMALPQHGIGLRAQEDTVRRAIVAWHDVFIGNPHAINVGVWQGNLDGSGFTNRQGNANLDLKQIYNILSGARVGGTVTAVTNVAHGMVVDDYLNISWTREFAGATLNRASNVVTATLGSGHQMQAGDIAFLFGAGSFSGTHTVTSANATQVFWAQVGANEGGSGTVKDRSSDVRQVQVTEIVNSTTFRYVDGKHDLTNLGTSTTANERLFPYFMEMRVSGTVVQVRCWSRHQSIPVWNEPTRSFNIDLDKADRVYTVTAGSRTSGISTLTIGAHDFAVGNIITVDVTDASGDVANGFVTGITATEVRYWNPGTDNGTLGTGTCTRHGGATTAADIATIPTPRGSGRVAVAAAHEGITQISHCSYGTIVGSNSYDSNLLPVSATGVFGFTGVASGVVRVVGAGVGSFGFTGTAAGRPRVVAAATGSFGFTGVASGITRVRGAATGSFGFAGAASGVVRKLGAATGLFGFTGSASGETVSGPVTGSGTGLFGFTGAASGGVRKLGAASGSFGFTGIAAGRPRVVGAATGSFGFTGIASGRPRVVGVAVGSFGFIGVAGGHPRVFGVAVGSFGFTGVAQGRTPAFVSSHRWAPTTEEILDLDGVRRRIDRFRFELCDRELNPIGELHPDRSGTVPQIQNDASDNTSRRLTGLKLTPDESSEVNTLTDRLRVYMTLQNDVEFRLGTFLWADDSRPERSWGSEQNAELVDFSYILSQPSATAYGWGKNATISLIIYFLMFRAGFSLEDIAVVGDEANRGLADPKTWEPGATWLQMLTDIGAVVGFTAPWFDRDGRVHFDQAPNPDVDRVSIPSYDTDTRIIADSIVRSDDMLAAPNIFTVYDSGSDRLRSGTYEIPSSAPHSFAKRGFRIAKVESVQGLSNQTIANQAARNLARSGDAFEWLTFSSTADPRHETLDVIEAFGERWLETAWTLELRSGGAMQHTMKRVTYDVV